jgi:hypothetical protein
MKAAVYLETTGEVIGSLSGDMLPPPEPGTKHLSITASVDPTGMAVAGGKLIARPAGYDAATWSWSTAAGAFVEDVAKVEAKLLADLKADAENRKMSFLTNGGAKKAEYAAKRAEVAFWDSLAGTATAAVAALAQLSAPTKSAKFAYATADAAAFGDTIAAAIERFRAGANRCAKVPEIAAAEAKATAAIRSATTPKMKRAAAAAVTWPA